MVAAFGTEAAFLLNGVAALALVAVLLFWRRQLPKDDLPRERLGSAVATGLRYVGETPALRAVLIRAAVFGIAASAALALLPLIARDRLGGGPVVYGLLLGAFGIGALLGAFLIHPLRQRRGAGVRGHAAVGRRRRSPSSLIGLLPELASRRGAGPGRGRHRLAGRVLDLQHHACRCAPPSGSRRACWRSTRPWCSAAWRWAPGPGASSPTGPAWRRAYLLAGCACCWPASPCTGACRSRPARRPTCSRPQRQEPLPTIQAAAEEGPVMVQIEYEVGPANAPAFVAAMDEVGHLRRRNGAVRWRLFQDVADGDRWTEVFVLGDWVEHQRLRRRMTMADAAARGPRGRLPSRRRAAACAATWSPAATTAASCSTRPSAPISRWRGRRPGWAAERCRRGQPGSRGMPSRASTRSLASPLSRSLT